ncbi:hypothetical protein J7L02_03900 [Candidatus Woesearchaeota archaeon]|nr:hypothetical protein [Candidatus Woesearchaeota archaeon]
MRKSQISSLDLMISLLVVSIVLIFSFKQLFNVLQSNEFSKLSREAASISSYLLSEGYPKNWTNETVVRIGLLSNNRINVSKLNTFLSMDYNKTKLYLNAFHDYAVVFSNASSPLTSIGCGKAPAYINPCNITQSFQSLNLKNLVIVYRLAVFNHSIVKVTVYEWV